MLTNKENYIRLLRREIPEQIPRSAFNMVCPSILRKDRTDKGGFDCFGVEYVTSPDTMNGAIPKPGKFLIEDITKWRDIAKLPDLSGVDWEDMAKKDLAKVNFDRGPIMSDAITGFFQGLINYTGFTEGLCACFEEPEEVKAMMEWFLDFYIDVAKKVIKYYKPEALWMPDDVCTERSPFVSPEMFRELFKPYWKRYVEVFLDAGIPAQLHCCGQCMPIVDDFVDCGFSAWDPAQASNDLVEVKKRHGNKIAIIGGFEGRGFAAKPETTEEEVRLYVRKVIDELAPGGGFAWSAMVMPTPGNESWKERNRWINEEFEAYGKDYYK